MTDYTEASPAPRRIRFDPTRGRSGRDYGHAHRHSRRVRWLKFALPAAAAAGVLGFFLAMQFEAGGQAVSLAGINIDSKSLVMKEPHISGFEGTRRAYEVTATRAIQDLDNPKVVTLETIHAKFGLDADRKADMDATIGIFDGNANTLKLKDGIVLLTSDGYRAVLDDADVDVDAGDLASNRPVEIHSAEGTIRAHGIAVSDHGKKVKFIGGVSVNFIPPGSGAVLPGPEASAP